MLIHSETLWRERKRERKGEKEKEVGRERILTDQVKDLRLM